LKWEVNLFLVIYTLFLIGCNNDAKSESNKNGSNLVITTIDNNGEIYPVSAVIWWYESDVESRYNLECNADLCDTWILPSDVSGQIYIESWNSVPMENDQYCADVYQGESNIYIYNDSFQEISIGLYYYGSVCS
jgi:hypothetical protein